MDAERFTDIFTRLHAKLRNIARNIVGDEEAPDMVQDVFCNLWRRRDTISDDGRVDKMFDVSLRNRCITEIRERERHPSRRLDGTDCSEENSESIFSEVQKVISECLSERDGQILILRDYSGWDFDELCEKFDMTPTAVRMALSRARRTVLRVYQERQGREGKQGK